jgi:protein-tyrosine-phosphatase
MKNKKIIFVCTGNICRSPMAEYLLRDALGADSDWEVSSAGTFAGNGMAASRAAVDVLAELGIDGSKHRSSFLDRELVDASTVIVVMTSGHKQHISLMFPDVEEKVFLLKSFSKEKGDVRDPIGASTDVYRYIRDEILEAVPELVTFLENLK